MRKIKLTRQEKALEDALVRGEYTSVKKNEFERIAEIVASRKKDAVLNIRVNSKDLAMVKKKAKKFGIKYQTFIAELIHRVAQT